VALTVGRGESVRTKITTTIEEGLLNKAKTLAKQEGLEGTNAIIERVLELYFTSIQSEVWEKSLSSGWMNKLGEVSFENRPSKFPAFVEDVRTILMMLIVWQGYYGIWWILFQRQSMRISFGQFVNW